MTTLLAADDLRARDADRAVDAYVALQDSIDSCDEDRVGWLASLRPEAPQELAPLFRRTLDRSCRNELRWQAALALGRMDRDPAESERYYRLIIEEARDLGQSTWLIACVNLAQIYRTTGRPFESLVLSRCAAQEADQQDDPVVRAVAHLHVCGVLSDIKDQRRLEAELESFRVALKRVPASEQVLHALYRGYRGELKRMRGDFEGALADMEHFDEFVRGPRVEEYRVETYVHRANVLLELDRLDEAGELIEIAREHPMDRTDFLLRLEMVTLRHALKTDGHHAVIARARDVLAGVAMAQAGNGIVLNYAAELGRILADDCDAFAEARHAFDLAASAALARIMEVDHCMRELPELAGPSPEDFAILADYRTRFVHEQSELLEAIARILQTRAGDVADLIVEGDLIAVCAWCQRVRAASSRWLPIANYIPRGDQFTLTHGICGSCSKQVRREAGAVHAADQGDAS